MKRWDFYYGGFGWFGWFWGFWLVWGGLVLIGPFWNSLVHFGFVWSILAWFGGFWFGLVHFGIMFGPFWFCLVLFGPFWLGLGGFGLVWYLGFWLVWFGVVSWGGGNDRMVVCRAICAFITNRWNKGLISVDRRTSLLSHVQYPVPYQSRLQRIYHSQCPKGD